VFKCPFGRQGSPRAMTTATNRTSPAATQIPKSVAQNISFPRIVETGHLGDESRP
jgi:hypothetical protein